MKTKRYLRLRLENKDGCSLQENFGTAFTTTCRCESHPRYVILEKFRCECFLIIMYLLRYLPILISFRINTDLLATCMKLA